MLELPHKLLNDLRLRVVRNSQTLEKSQIWMDPSVQSSRNKTLAIAVEKMQNYISQFSSPIHFTGCFYLVPNILSQIAEVKSAF